MEASDGWENGGYAINSVTELVLFWSTPAPRFRNPIRFCFDSLLKILASGDILRVVNTKK